MNQIGSIDLSAAGYPITILLADDDEDDTGLTMDTFEVSRLANELSVVRDGEELLDHLHQRGDFAHHAGTPQPGLILLDLNMPRMDGREALKQIKEHPELRMISFLY